MGANLFLDLTATCLDQSVACFNDSRNASKIHRKEMPLHRWKMALKFEEWLYVSPPKGVNSLPVISYNHQSFRPHSLQEFQLMRVGVLKFIYNNSFKASRNFSGPG